MTDSTIPTPRPLSSSISSRSVPSTPSQTSHKPSVSVSPALLTASPRVVPVPVPQRHGSFRQSIGSSDYPRRHGYGSQSQSQSSGSSGSFLASTSVPSSSIWGDVTVQRSKSDRRSMHLPTRPMVVRGENEGWLDISVGEILGMGEGKGDDDVITVEGEMEMEKATDILLKSGQACLLVQLERGYGFFDYADLNTFLLVVLQAATPKSAAPVDPFMADCAILEEEDDIIKLARRLKKGDKLKVKDVCDVSQKNPYHARGVDNTLRGVLPLFASGLHRIAVIDKNSTPRILNATTLMEHLLSLPGDNLPGILSLPVSSPRLNLALHPLISLPGSATVLDAMQVMSQSGLTALGVISGSSMPRLRRQSSNSSDSGVTQSSSLTSSPLLMPDASPDGVDGAAPRTSIVTAQDCASLVVPSEGKQVLGMDLETMTKGMQQAEQAGQARGEERFPVHTVTSNTTLLHACHLMLATSSSRVFLRTSTLISPPMSPVPSLSTSISSPPLSPSISSLSLSHSFSGGQSAMYHRPTNGLPIPPMTQLSSHQVISISDVLACLAKSYHSQLASSDSSVPQFDSAVIASPSENWDLDPAGMIKR